MAPPASLQAALGVLQLGGSPRKAKGQANDEVAAILKGLRLDKSFFLGKLSNLAMKDLKPQEPGAQDAQSDDESPTGTATPAGSTSGGFSMSAGADGGSPSNLMKASRSKAKKKTTTTIQKQRRKLLTDSSRKVEDFDIYLGEAVLPVLTQALDSLCRQLARMKFQGDKLDPKVRMRFNPLTWLAQKLLRLHPRVAKTPRRLAIAHNFSTWSDQERGRREMLRRMELVKQVFEGFVTNRHMYKDTLPTVISAVDETLRLNGVLENNKHIRAEFSAASAKELNDATVFRSGSSRMNSHRHSHSGSRPGSRGDPQQGAPKRSDKRVKTQAPGQSAPHELVTFNKFWYDFTSVLMRHDVVPYSALERGIRAQQQEAVQLASSKEAVAKDEDEKKKQEALQRTEIAQYAGLYDKLVLNREIQGILTEGKLLTGDDVRPGDAGFEFEVPPKGTHVDLLRQFLVSLGFEKLNSTEEYSGDPSARWWDNELADSWLILQDMLGAELRDGVVEKETLEQVLVMPAALLTLKARIEDELEHRANNTFGPIMDSKESKDEEAEMAMQLGSVGKPTLEQLSQRLGITMARLDFLHKLFESYLADEEGNPVQDDAYPEDPKFLTREVMKALMMEVRPDMHEAEFESRFKRIDVDGSGEIEFDEFIVWVREDEIRVVGGNKGKESFEELAVKYDEHPEVLRRIYAYFKDALPEGVEDRFPEECVSMDKPEVRKLFQDINPEMGDSEFEAQWQMIDMEGRGDMSFPDVLELIDFDLLIDDIAENLPVVEE